MSSLPLSSPFSSMTDEELLDFFCRTPTSILPAFMTADLSDFQSQTQSRTLSFPRTTRPYRTRFQTKQDKLKLELKNAPTLVSHDFDQETGESLLLPIPWPRNKRGRPVGLGSLQKYCSDHEFLERIFCFCSAEPGTSPVPVKLFVVRKKDSEHYNDPCLGCRNWEKGEGAGCGFFLNMRHFVLHHPRALQDTFNYPLKPSKQTVAKPHVESTSKPRLFHGGLKAQRIADYFPLPENSTWRMPPRLPAIQSAQPLTEHEVADNVTINPFLVDGSVVMADRLFQPPPPNMISRNVRELAPPNHADTRAMLLELLGRGVQMHDLLRLIGACNICRYIIALCVFPEHDCIRDVVERREDGSWVSMSPLASPPLGPSPAPVSPADLEHWFFNTTTPPHHPRYPTPPRIPHPFPLNHMVSSTAASSSQDSTTTVWPTSPPGFAIPLSLTPSPSTRPTSARCNDVGMRTPTSAAAATTASSSTMEASPSTVAAARTCRAESKKRAADDDSEIEVVQVQKKRCIGHIDLTDF
ncbi:hypothetical protein NM688_g6087 [Phlebia brevispora]|uniref:Uncharacterized protein n=1 Tax=Phlebia brevispora TaxID=194682 RepID=A0ACC1SK05_9APHY|nr:hypothetical protein NM688_g6087 [Phlebia brevispora]